VGDEVGAGAQHTLGVVEVVDVSRDPQATFVGLIDDGLIHGRRHPGRRAEVVVHPDLHEVGPHRRDLVDLEPRLLRRRGHDHRARDADPRPVQGWRVVGVTGAKAGRRVAAEAVDGGDAVPGVKAQLPEDVLRRVQLGARSQPHHVPDVAVGVDQARDHRLGGQVDALGPVRDSNARARSHGLDPAAAHDDDGALGRGPAGAVDQPRAHEGLHAGRGGGIGSRGEE